MAENLRSFLGSAGSHGVYIYGAGVVAYYLARKVLSSGQKVNAFVVSSKNGNVDNYFGIPVHEISEISSDDAYVIVGVLEEKQGEISFFLNASGFTDFYALKDSEYRKIRSESPDISAELFHWNRKLVQDISNARTAELHLSIRSAVDRILYGSSHYRGCQRDEERYREEFNTFRENGALLENKLGLLLRGLDNVSRMTVFQIVSRLHALCDGSPILYNAKEKAQVQRVWNEYRTDGTINGYKLGQEKYTLDGDVFLPEGRFEEIVFLYEHGLPLLKHPERLRQKCVLDAGAYIGDSAAIIAKKYTDNVIYSFEPMMDNYLKISETAKLNGLENRIFPVHAALSNKQGSAALYRSEFLNTCNSLFADGIFVHEDAAVEEVECLTVDDFVAQHDIQVGLIKTDVEGAERYLLQGAENTLRTQRPALSIAIYHSVSDFFEIKPWLESLGLGYRFQIFRPTVDFSFMLETVLLAETE